MIRIVTDSSCDLPSDLAGRHRVAVVPLTIRFGNEEFIDGVDLTPSQFWLRLETTERLPETAAPGVGTFLDAYGRLAGEGASGVLVICLSSDLSATYQSAVIAAEQFDRIPVKVVDSRIVSMALGLQVVAAAIDAEAGAPLEEAAARAADAVAATNLMAAMETLEYLRRGGRIGAAQALVGSLLDIKPLISFADGVVTPVGRVRTRARARQAMLAHVAELAPRLERIAVIHGGSPDVTEFARLVRSAAGQDPIIAGLGPVVGTHSGPGVLGVAYQLA